MQLTLDAQADDQPPAERDQELLVRAAQIDKLTWKQRQDIRQRLIDLGLPEEIASTTPWLAADPQSMLDQLKRPRHEVLAPGVTGIALRLDVLLAALVRAPENLRMGEKRYSGRFSLPRYGSTRTNSACTFDLRDHEDAQGTLFRELGKIDDEIDVNNRYREDIKTNGVHTGGILFPLMLGLPDQPWLGGWETADCYGRTYFVQKAEDISAGDVLEWLRKVPTDATELRAHPLQARRSRLLSIAGKVREGTPVTEHERSTLRRAVMPNTKLVLTVDGQVRMAEARRRLVAQQHLDRPTEFTPDTEWQTRAEAVVEALYRKNMLATWPGMDLAEARSWLDHPAKASREGHHADDIAVLAVASLWRSPKTREDRVISEALRSRGVTGTKRRGAGSELAARVVARNIRDDGRDGRRSALERVLSKKELRDLDMDVRPMEEIVEAARVEFRSATAKRSQGKKPEVGPATKQIMARAGFFLTCGVGAHPPLLRRSAHGARQGDAYEPGEVLLKLAQTEGGLEQLAQVVFDGRAGHPVREVKVKEGEQAKPHPYEPSEEERISSDRLRELALTEPPPITDDTASAQVAQDTEEIHKNVELLELTVKAMGERQDDGFGPHVYDHGWRDSYGIVTRLEQQSRTLQRWSMLHDVKNFNPAPRSGEEGE